MKAVICTLVLFATTAWAKPLPADSTVNPAEKPFSKCYQKAKNYRVGRKELLSTAQLVTVFKKAPAYPEGGKGKSACVFIVYDALKDGKADKLRVMEAEPRDKAFTDA